MTLTLLALTLLTSQRALRLEAEEATLEGPRVTTTRPGFSGKGYVTDVTQPKARIVWRGVRAAPGIYEARLGYSASSDKGFELGVNGSRSSAMLAATGEKFGMRRAGKIEIRAGENEISIERGWGYYDVDYLELVPAAARAKIKPIAAKLVDPKATPEARRLYADLLRRYGTSTFSGQYELDESAWVAQQTGRTPAILGGDLMDYSPSRLPFFDKPPKDLVPSWIDAARKGQILTLSWHWNAPKDLINKREHRNAEGQVVEAMWYSGFYTRATTFDAKKAMADPNSEEYRLILRDIDAIAVQLKRLRDAKVPVLWRPLHEADGGWFWWGAKGPETGKALWRLVFDRLTKHHRIHNLVWVWNSPKPEWYPGDDTVDIMSVDEYPADRRDALSTAWEDQLARFNGRKPLALAEFPGVPDLERMRRFGVRWLYFVSWTGGVGPKSTPKEVLKGTYASKTVISLPAKPRAK